MSGMPPPADPSRTSIFSAVDLTEEREEAEVAAEMERKAREEELTDEWPPFGRERPSCPTQAETSVSKSCIVEISFPCKDLPNKQEQEGPRSGDPVPAVGLPERT